MAELVEVKLRNLFRTEHSGGGVFLGNEEKTFAMFMGPPELNALILAEGGVVSPRPLTHNLLDMILSGFDIEVRSVVISDLVDDSFHAVLKLGQGAHEVEIDCRPSDALVVAVMRKKPVYVSRALFERVEDGEMLLSALRNGRKPERAEPETEPRKKGRKPRKKEQAEEKAPSPEGGLGDVREIPGIDWSSLGG